MVTPNMFDKARTTADNTTNAGTTFHHYMAKPLFLCKQIRQDEQP